MKQRILICKCSTEYRADELRDLLNQEDYPGGAISEEENVYIEQDEEGKSYLYDEYQIKTIQQFGKAWSKMIDAISV